MPRVCQRCQHENADEARFCLQCGNMLEIEAQQDADPLVGKVLLQRYRVLQALGEGGMGKVYLAEQKMGTATRKVAIKTLHPELGDDEQLAARFRRECETVVELSHPNTVQFYDFGELDDGTLFIVMEYIEGESLAHVLQRGALDPARADKIFIQICGSLHEAHQRGVVHRDLKPENILLTSRGGQQDFVKVLDFGIAKRNEAEDQSRAKLTKQGMVLGTPPYMSPEQFSGQSLDARSDIYSLAALAYEALTGQLPFEANTPWEWATKHLTAQPTPIETQPIGDQVPERKRAAIMRALAKDRDHRQQSVLDFMNELTGVQDAQAAWTLATTPSGAQPAQAASATGGPAAEPRGPVGTPQPMAQQQAPSAQDSPRAPAVGTDPAASSGTMPGESTSMASARPAGIGAGKIVTALVVMVFVMGGAAAAGLWYWTQGNGDTGLLASGSDLPVDSASASGTASGDSKQVPSTPSERGNDGATADAASDTASDATGSSSEEETPADEDGDGSEQESEGEANSAGTRNRTRDRRGGSERRHHSHSGGRAGGAQVAAHAKAAAEALQRGDWDGAVQKLRAAQRQAGGKNHPAIRDVRSQLAQRASNQVGILMQQGQCGKAQALYRKLRTVSAHRSAGQQFSPDWCPRP